jgi:hypothetical protein
LIADEERILSKNSPYSSTWDRFETVSGQIEQVNCEFMMFVHFHNGQIFQHFVVADHTK